MDVTRLFEVAVMQSAVTPISVCSENCLTLACLQLPFAVTSMALGYAASDVRQTAVLSSASNDIPHVGGHGSNHRKQRFKFLFGLLCSSPFDTHWEGASTDAKALHLEISNEVHSGESKRVAPGPLSEAAIIKATMLAPEIAQGLED